ncbi:MAG: Potassium channel [Gammaproteobacteria bacterium]|nr:Potassium channel [Gammaproteobacteria bacterium]
MGENHFAAVPSALYGGVLLAAAAAYWILQQRIIADQGSESPLRAAIGGDWKGKLSPALYVLGIISTFLWPWVALALYVVVALVWLVPDRRIERSLHRNDA